MKTVWKSLLPPFLIASLISIQSCGDEQIADNAQPVVQITISSSSIGFGDVEANSYIDQQITITNSFSVNQRLEGTITLTGNGFSVMSGTGSFSLSPGESKIITVRFTPSSGGIYSGILNITHNALNTSSPIRIPLSGSSQSPSTSAFSLNVTSLDFGTVGVGQSSSETMTMTNPSNSTQTVSGNIQMSGNGFSIISGSGQFNLSPGQSKDIIVRFIPSTTGSYAGSITISHNASGTLSPIIIPLSGSTQTATAGIISVTPNSIDFGKIGIGRTEEEIITISNSTTSTVTITGSVSLNFGATGYSIARGFGSYTLSAGQSRTVTVRFSGASTGTYSGSVNIYHNAPNAASPITVTLRGELYKSISISVLPSSINFGTVPTSQIQFQTITISNGGTSTGNLVGSITIGGTGFTLASGSGSYTLEPEQSKIVNVRFSPVSASSYSGMVRIYHNSTNTSSPISIPLGGNGQNVITTSISVNPTSLNFGTVNVGQTDDQAITISNSGSSTRNVIGNITVSGTGFTLSSGSGSYSLTPGQSKTLNVRFSPLSAFSYFGTVRIFHNAANTSSPVDVPLSGSGKNVIVVNIAVDPTSLNFGTVTVGHTSDQAFTIMNPSTSTQSLTGSTYMGSSGTGFTFASGNGSYNLSPGQSRIVTIRFAPRVTSAHSGSVQISHNARNISTPVTISLRGFGGR